VTAQINARRDAKMKRLIRAADLREPGASLSSKDYDPVRNLQRARVPKTIRRKKEHRKSNPNPTQWQKTRKEEVPTSLPGRKRNLHPLNRELLQRKIRLL
ncbi:MAG: hypothetical protein Q4D71_08515, partial [Oscillospiraceae bacterium]|nr:hypothetical protein [Oscillospiraceae bacterium]